MKRSSLILGIITVFLVQGAVLSLHADDWVMGFHDSRHTGQTSEVVTPPLTVAWTWTDTNPYDNSSQWSAWESPHFWLPLFYHGKLYFQGGLNGNRVFCLNPTTGVKLWEVDNGYTQTGNDLFQFDNYPTAVKGRIINAGTDFTATADAATGGDYHNRYNTNGAFPNGGAATWNDLAYLQFIRTDDGSESFDIVHDPVAWDIGFGYSTPNGTTTFSDASFRVPAVDSYSAYVNFQGQLAAVDAISSAVKWIWGTKNFGASPAAVDGTVYFYASNQQKLVALDAAQGTVKWSVPIHGAYSPIVSEGVLYVGSSDGGFYALDTRTGAFKWSSPFQTGQGFTSLQIPAISGNLIYVPSTDGTLYVLNKNTGQMVWSYTSGHAWGPVVIGGGTIYTSDLSETFYAFHPQTASIGPSETALSITRISNSQPTTVNLTGAGFFAGGPASAVQQIRLDNAAQTIPSGYTVANDQTITGVVIPAGLAPGLYHIKVQTNAGLTSNEPLLDIEPANSAFASSLGVSGGDKAYGTQMSFQRHLARTSNGTLIGIYAGSPAGTPSTEQDLTYNVSRDGGLTWTGQIQLTSELGDRVTVFQPTASIWMDAQDELAMSYTHPYTQSFEKFSITPAGLLSQVPGVPAFSVSGNPYYGGPGVTEAGGRLWIAYAAKTEYSYAGLKAGYSDDGGKTWTGTPIDAAAISPAALVLFQGKPAVLYSQAGGLAWSFWNGTQWSAPELLPGPIKTLGLSLSATATSTNQIHVTYTSSGGIGYAHYNGSSWLASQVLDPTGTTPSLTTNGTDLWCFYINSSHDLVYRRTRSGSWDRVIYITQDGNQNNYPSTLALSPDATIPVIWTAGTVTPHYQVKSAVVLANRPAPGPNHPPVAVSQSLTTDNHTPLNILLSGTDADPDPLTFTVASQPAHGTLSGTLPNLVYTPNQSYLGTDVFTFQVNDGLVDSAPGTISINVHAYNHPPVAHFTATPMGGMPPLQVTFDANGSYDPDGTIAAYAWDFGDGQVGSGPNQAHLYTVEGTYSVTLQVTDNLGTVTSTTTVIGALPPPQAPFTLPAANATVSGTTSIRGYATTYAPQGLMRTEIYIDDILVSSQTFANFAYPVSSSIFQYFWNTLLYPDGPHQLKVIAYDMIGEVATNQESVNVLNNVDVTPPQISITSPANGASVSGIITIAGTASDNIGVSQVTVAIDQSPPTSVVGTTSWSYALDTTNWANGPHTLVVLARDTSGNTTSKTLSLTIANISNTNLASYDATLMAPACRSLASICDSGTLLNGRGTMNGGPESHTPNTLQNSCADGNSGSYHSDESNDRLKISTIDGSPFASGKTVVVEATVWAWTSGPIDALDLYYTATANSPVWTYLGTFYPSQAGSQVLSTQFTLNTGTLQAVRAHFRYSPTQPATPSPCTSAAFDDQDDLAFAVASEGAPTGPSPSSSASFVKTDIATQGNWQSVYGGDGFAISGVGQKMPSSAQVNISGQNWTQMDSSIDIRALQKPNSDSRIISWWYGAPLLDVNLTDHQPHQVALYLLDWNSSGVRKEQVTISDAATGVILDTRTFVNFQNGQYGVWDIQGHVKIRVASVDTSGFVTIVSGFFLGGGASSPLGGLASVETFNELDSMRIYPNPWRSNRDNGKDITFDHLPAGSIIKIFTISARWGVTLTADAGGQAAWNLRNADGDKVASGLYLYLITDGQGHTIHGKFAIIR